MSFQTPAINPGRHYVQVTIWHNQEHHFRDHKPSDRMAPVFTYATPSQPGSDPLAVAWEAVQLTDVDGPEMLPYDWTDSRAIVRRYRANKCRSFSHGDVVQVEDKFFASTGIDLTPVGRDDIRVTPWEWGRELWGEGDPE